MYHSTCILVVKFKINVDHKLKLLNTILAINKDISQFHQRGDVDSCSLKLIFSLCVWHCYVILTCSWIQTLSCYMNCYQFLLAVESRSINSFNDAKKCWQRMKYRERREYNDYSNVKFLFMAVFLKHRLHSIWVKYRHGRSLHLRAEWYWEPIDI